MLEVMDEDIVSDGSTDDEGEFVESIDSMTMSSFLSNNDVYKKLFFPDVVIVVVRSTTKPTMTQRRSYDP